MVSEQLAIPGIELPVADPQPLRVVHCRHDPYDIYIGRGSIWGNPFSSKPSMHAVEVVDSPEEAVRLYRQWIRTQPQLLAKLPELRGKVLGCWCRSPRRRNAPCHGDVLVELSNVC